ncbi:hypothetical protein [Streptomyces sirii]|uniref:hypothetical protein n=1 Tax=Streptomyces sirii TaxID=3127701 RepID=UPI003D369219
MLAAMALLAIVGSPDAFGAQTFAGRMTGSLFVFLGAVEGVAALAVLDYWGKRRWKFSGAVVLVGALIATSISSLLLLIWLQEREFTKYLLIYLPLWFWSLWALWVVIREKSWKGTPHPKKFAAGVTVTVLIAAANLAYTDIYQPATTPVLFKLEVKFGKPRIDANRPIIQLPLVFHATNVGKVAGYILNDDYWLYGRSLKFSYGSEGQKKSRAMMESGYDVGLHVSNPVDEILSTGQPYDVGSWLEPGEEVHEEKVIQLPKDSKYDLIGVHMEVTEMRKDRGKLGSDYSLVHFSWEKSEGKSYCPPEKCYDHVFYQGRVRHNNNLVNVTRRPRYITATWGAETPMETFVETSIYGPKSKVSEEEADRYGIVLADTEVQIPFAALLSPSDT